MYDGLPYAVVRATAVPGEYDAELCIDGLVTLWTYGWPEREAFSWALEKLSLEVHSRKLLRHVQEL
jgi:hypothetical protein